MQNRIGLRNPGAAAAAAFLASVAGELPPTWGVSLAASPGVDDLDLMAQEIAEAAGAFERAFGGHPRSPAWFTLNLSCPNTEDDPHGRQTEALARRLADALRSSVRAPVWAKVGPDLSDDQLAGLVSALTAAGVRAIVATNTVARPAPEGRGHGGAQRGTACGRWPSARWPGCGRSWRDASGAPDIVACGGILEGADLRAFMAAGARAAMIYSALVFRGPLAAALILREAERARRCLSVRCPSRRPMGRRARTWPGPSWRRGPSPSARTTPVTFRSGPALAGLRGQPAPHLPSRRLAGRGRGPGRAGPLAEAAIGGRGRRGERRHPAQLGRRLRHRAALGVRAQGGQGPRPGAPHRGRRGGRPADGPRGGHGHDGRLQPLCGGGAARRPVPRSEPAWPSSPTASRRPCGPSRRPRSGSRS